MFGREMMVAPVVYKSLDSIDVYLPGNYWYNFWDDTKLKGGKWVRMVTDIHTIPVFVKPGSFIPMVNPVNTTDNYSSAEMTIRYYPGQPGDSTAFNVFEDDGKTYGTIDRGEFELLRLKAKDHADGNLNIEMIRDGWNYNNRPKIRQIKLEIVGRSVEKNILVRLNDKKLKKIKKNRNSGYYLSENNRLTIEFLWDGSFTEIKITNKK
jgi:oligosaccharide 4-alpha-D-glucosyltransferase